MEKAVKKKEQGDKVTGKVLMVGLVAVGGYLLLKAMQPPPDGEVWYTCPYCGAIFSTQVELDAHIASMHPPPPDISHLIADAEYWAGEAEAAADAALGAMDIYQVAPQVNIAINAMNAAGDATAEAIRIAGTEAATAAIVASDRAIAAYNIALDKLNTVWRDAMVYAESEMVNAETAALNAMGIYDEAKATLDGIQGRMVQIRAEVQGYYAQGGPIQVINYVVGSGWVQTTYIRDIILQTLAPEMESLYIAEENAIPVVNSTRDEAYRAAGAARDAAIYAQSMADDVLLLGILIATANSLYSIATATRDRIDQMLAELG